MPRKKINIICSRRLKSRCGKLPARVAHKFRACVPWPSCFIFRPTTTWRKVAFFACCPSSRRGFPLAVNYRRTLTSVKKRSRVSYAKIHACPNSCMLYYGRPNSDKTEFDICGHSRYKENPKLIASKSLIRFCGTPRLLLGCKDFTFVLWSLSTRGRSHSSHREFSSHWELPAGALSEPCEAS